MYDHECLCEELELTELWTRELETGFLLHRQRSITGVCCHGSDVMLRIGNWNDIPYERT